MKYIILAMLFLLLTTYANAQNVGIGIANPTKAKLEVNGAVGATSAIFGGESSGVSLQRNWPGIGFNQYYNGGSRYLSNGFAAVQFVDPGTGHMMFDMFANGTANSIASATKRAMVITNDGRVTIGSGDYPPATLYVARGDAIDGTAVFSGTTHRSHFNYATDENTYIRAGKNNGTVFINDIPGGKVFVGGNVGINQLNPVFPLEVRQNFPDAKSIVMVDGVNFNFWGFLISVTTGHLWLSYGGYGRGIYNAGTGQYSAISDKRLKTNIRHLPSSLGKLMQLQPVVYDMVDRKPADSKNLGFIAQDVKELFPELVTVSPDTSHGYKGITDLHTINYSGFSVLAIKAIQEQQVVIQSLQLQLDELRKTVLEFVKGSPVPIK